MQKFTLIQQKEMWCSESAAASIAVLFNRHYEMMFSELWMFCFDEEQFLESKKIGNSISLGVKQNRIFELLEIFHGVSSTFHEIGNSQKLLELTREEVAFNRPVLINFDSYYSPWAPAFEKKNRFLSAYFILDIDKNGFKCFDIHYLRQLEFLPMENFMQGARNATLYSLTKNHELDFDWREILQKQITQLYSSSPKGTVFNSIRSFAHCILKELNYLNEFSNIKDFSGMNDMHNTPLLKNLTDICRSRGLYAMTLHYLGEKFKIQELISISEQMELIGSKWAMVFSLLYKGFFSSFFNDSLKESLYNKIIELATLEEKLADSLLKIIHRGMLKNSCSEDNNMIQNGTLTNKSKKILFLDISSCFNNKGVYSDIQLNYVTGLNGVGDYLILDKFPFGSELKINNASFVVPKLQDYENDNISCNGQVINLTPGMYSKIMLLGYSDFMNHYESLKLVYDDCEQVIPLQFSYWFNSPRCGEEKAWTGELIRKMIDSEEHFSFSANIFSQVCILNPNKLLKKIYLPICPNIHIFAISLEIFEEKKLSLLT